MSKKKHDHEEHIDESWLIPYADLLTLLLALFIVLFAASSINKSKFEQLIRTFQSEFKGGTGSLQYASITPELDPEASVRDDKKTQDTINEKYFEETSKEQQEQQQKIQDEMSSLEKIKQQIDQYIVQNNLSEQFKTNLDKEGLKLLMLDTALFAPGSAEIEGKYRTISKEISNLLVSDIPRKILISGHTDNQPIARKDLFKSNWELSTARATNFLHVLLENKQLDPELFTVTGNGEYKPIDTNDTKEGRANNRRVEVLILPLFDLQ